MKKTAYKECPLADYICGLDYGGIVRHQDIEKIIREKKGTSRYYNAIAKAKKIALENGKMIKRFGGGDYQVIYPGDYVNAYQREVRIANNCIKRGDKIIHNAPVRAMTVAEKIVYDRAMDFHTTLFAKSAGGLVELKKLTERRAT